MVPQKTSDDAAMLDSTMLHGSTSGIDADRSQLFATSDYVLIRAQQASRSVRMELLVALVAIVLIVTPIIAVMAFSGLRRIENSLGNLPLQSLISRVYALEQQLAALEKKLAAGLESKAQPEIQPVEPSREEGQRTIPIEPPSEPIAQSEGEAEASSRPEFPAPIHPAQALGQSKFADSSVKKSIPVDLERLIGGSWLNRVGIVALIAAVSFFLKYAFDNNWIGPRGRVGIGVLLGAAMLPWSQWLLSRGYAYFSESIAALGAAVLYLSLWAGWHYYTLFSQSVAFASMIVVTAAMSVVALGRNSQRIAVMSLIGGFLTPAIISTGKDQQVVLFTYLLILGAGLLVMAARRDWRWPAPLVFVFSQIYFWDWYETFYTASKLERTAFFATLFFLLYAAMPTIRSLRVGRIATLDIGLLLLNACAYLSTLYAMLWPEWRWTFTLFVLVLSAMHIFAARLIPAPKTPESPLTRLLFAGLALTFATLAIPIRLEGKWMTLAFAVEGAVLAFTGFRAPAMFVRQAGYVLLALAAIRILAFPPAAGRFLLNQRFGTYLALIVCFAAVLIVEREHADDIGEGEKQLLGIMAVGVNVYALIALSLELWDYFGHSVSLEMDRRLAQHLTLSLLWTAYATMLILTGVKRSSALVRWQALALFGLVVVKVFMIDSAYLDRFYRIISFFVLGVVLLVVSFLYQRRAARERVSP
jgi:uncharacterized membrane protein